MKVKALKTFLSGKFSAERGEMINDMPERTARKLISIRFVEEVKEGEDREGETPEEGQKVEEKPIETKKPAAKKPAAGKTEKQ